MHNTATCDSCGSSIYWAETSKGKRMPINADPVEDGNILLLSKLVDATGRRKLVAAVITKNDRVDPSRNRYVAHFVTCPQADKHRKGTT